MPDTEQPSAWSRKRQDLKDEITQTALQLFLAKGYDATTVDEIAAQVGISRRSLFRYFGTKEDIVLGGLVKQGRAILAELEQRPPDEDPWQALITALTLAAPDVPKQDLYDEARMHIETPALKTNHLAKQLEWQQLLAPELARRLGGSPANDLKANAMVAVSLACIHVGTEEWVRRGGAGELADLCLEAVAAIRP